MTTPLREVMTRNPVAMDGTETCAKAAQVMADSDIGDVLVRRQDGTICGIVTDRDIVVRGVAKGRDPAATPIDDVCTHELVTLSPDDDVEKAVKLMREKAIRRLPVIENGWPVGIVSLGDLAEKLEPNSALGKLSAAPPNN